MTTKSAREEAQKYVCQNRRARHDYAIDEIFEAGMVLVGSEVKALRAGHAHLTDAYAAVENGELWLRNAHIGQYASAREQHGEQRPRKLLLRHREIDKLAGALERKGYTLVPLAIYFNERGFAKVRLGLARGKKEWDRRGEIADRESRRDMERALKARR